MINSKDCHILSARVFVKVDRHETRYDRETYQSEELNMIGKRTSPKAAIRSLNGRGFDIESETRIRLCWTRDRQFSWRFLQVRIDRNS